MTTPERSRTRRQAIIAAACGAALLVGGSTYALWSATDTVDFGTVTAGDLNLAQVGTVSYYDVSPDRADTSAIEAAGGQLGHTIDSLTDYRIVPGDTLAGVAQYGVTLEGDNLVANLTVEPAAAATNSFTGTNLTLEMQVFDAEGTELTDRVAAATGVLLQATGDGQTDGTNDQVASADVPVVEVPAAETANINVVVYVSFADVNERVDADAAAVFNGMVVTLEQVREGTSNFTTAPTTGS
ncbi:MAG: alternate-type signal peptide domain-containing protein [Propionibacteriaceae bacterium]|jgi:alternate signal-mediated exported protein|nr:alternate-type signal peptide domain-containing protein [Propionibacteriaceae bacterium]